MKSWYWSVDNYRWLQASLSTCINRKCRCRTNFQFFQNFTFRILKWKESAFYVTFDCFKKRGSLTDTEEASRDNFSRELRFKIGLPISRHNFTQSHSHCLMLTKTKIIKKIAGLAHVVFIRSLLFSLFLSRSTSCDCESSPGRSDLMLMADKAHPLTWCALFYV